MLMSFALAALVAALSHGAQEGTPVAPPARQAKAAAPDPDTADLFFSARVTARSMRFGEAPRTHVEFTGHPARVTNSHTERTNIPKDPQPGVTYRNVELHFTVVSAFEDIDKIVAEVLGSAPRSATPPESRTNPAPKEPRP